MAVVISTGYPFTPFEKVRTFRQRVNFTPNIKEILVLTWVSREDTFVGLLEVQRSTSVFEGLCRSGVQVMCRSFEWRDGPGLLTRHFGFFVVVRVVVLSD